MRTGTAVNFATKYPCRRNLRCKDWLNLCFEDDDEGFWLQRSIGNKHHGRHDHGRDRA